MTKKRLLESPAPASSSGEEGEESVREDNHLPDSDSDTHSDDNVSAFKIMPIVHKSAMRDKPEPDESGDSKAIDAYANETPKKKKKKMKDERGKSSVVPKKRDKKSSDPSKKVNNVVPHTDVVVDDEMAEPSDEPTLRVILGLPSMRALEKNPKTNKSGKDKSKDKIVSVSKRLKGKEKVTGKETVGFKGKLEVAVVGDETGREDLSLIGDEKGFWWEDLSKIDSDKAEELKGKWRQLRVEELELFVLKNELLKENGLAVIDAMKAASHS